MRLVTDPASADATTATKRLLFELRQCLTCSGSLVVKTFRPCPDQHRALYGKPCRYCNATRKVDHRHIQVGESPCFCTSAGTPGQQMETRYDHVPASIWSQLDFVVLPQDRYMTWVESFLGIGAAYSCVDYGASAKLPNDELIDVIRNRTDSFTQALNILQNRDDPSTTPLVAVMVIVRFRDGYKVCALPPPVLDQLELPAPASAPASIV